ncbi:MAG: hypothetical protein CVU63_22875 [Deltaproteobacteria bacterium HGW-Deltaproteobacteria-20]|nr:MAG: hypothetical protein CVU63_22875 [Deltaproteobacteria bacterium HGW-Deltaproteobacteria-20]
MDTLPMLMRGVWYTIYLTVGGLFFGFLLGVATGLMKLARPFFVRKLAGARWEQDIWLSPGRSIGLTRAQTMRYIIWPQAFKRMIPPLGNQFIISLKDTSLLMVIGVGELLRTGQEIVAVNFRAFEVYMAVAMVYLVMTMSIAKALKILETRLINKTSGKRA